MTAGIAARAAIVAAAGRIPTVEDVELAGPGPGEVLVRIVATGVCHTDLLWAEGTFAAGFPVVLGHETAGVVVEIGSAVRSLAPGDRVVLAVTNHCGACESCERGLAVLCAQRHVLPPRLRARGAAIVQGFGVGGFASHATVSANAAVRIPHGVPPAVAAVLGCAVATGVGAVLNVAAVRPGERVAVIGAGAVGLAAVMAAQASGAALVAVADPDPTRRAAAERLGADRVAAEAVALCREGGFEHVFECVGRITAVEAALGLTAPGGTTTLLGATPVGAAASLDVLGLIVGHRRVLGCNMGGLRPHTDFAAYLRMYRAGRLPLDELVSATVPLSCIGEAFDLARQRRGIRTVVLGDRTNDWGDSE